MGGFDRQAAAALYTAADRDWFSASRQAARAAWLVSDWPGRKTEEWKYTSLSALETDSWLRVPPVAAAGAEAGIPGLDADYIVFRNGRFDQAGSSFRPVAGVHLHTVKDAPEHLRARFGGLAAGSGNPFAALAACWTEEAVLLHVEDGVRLTRPVCVIHVGEPSAEGCAWAQRLLLLAGARSEMTLIEHFPAGCASFVPGLTEIELQPGAQLRHMRLQLDAEQAVHIGGVHVELREASAYRGFVLATGSRLKRLDIRLRHLGPGADAALDAVYLARNSQLVDLHTTVEHDAPHCSTREVCRGIVDDEARGVFNGRILIKPGAQKTSAELSNRNLLLSDRAEVDTKPELEIYADDVKCSHGATVSRIDEKNLYYLQSRGIARQEAEVLLAFGFVNALFAGVGIDAVQALLDAGLRTWFGSKAPERLA